MTRRSLTLVRCFLAGSLALVAAPRARADPAPPFVLPAEGCPMAHCDPQMTDRNPIPAPPAGAARSLWHDPSVEGSSVGVGCSSNGRVVACSVTKNDSGDEPPGSNLVVYDAWGNRLGGPDGFAGVGAGAYASAPMVGADGSVVAADREHLFRFDPGGQLRWSAHLDAGLPISPILAAGDAIVIATKADATTGQAPVTAHAVDDGTLLGELQLSDPAGVFETMNTPAAHGNRIYVLSALKASAGGASGEQRPRGRLYALDLDPAAGDPARGLRVAWWFDFTGPSGASPLVVPDAHGRAQIFFDGDGLAGEAVSDPSFFGVLDEGAGPRLLWQHSLSARAQASAALDPRGGFWVFGAGDSSLLRLGLGGEELQEIDLADLGRGLLPSSVMSIAGPDDAPVMLVSATSTARRLAGRSLLLAVDLTSGTERWRFETGARALGQYPVLWTGDGRTVAVASTSTGGIFGVIAGP